MIGVTHSASDPPILLFEVLDPLVGKDGRRHHVLAPTENAVALVQAELRRTCRAPWVVAGGCTFRKQALFGVGSGLHADWHGRIDREVNTVTLDDEILTPTVLSSSVMDWKSGVSQT